MTTRRASSALSLVVWLAATVSGVAVASVVEPSRDDEAVALLPAVSGNRAELRRLRQQLVVNPKAVESAITLAMRYLGEARSQGDPR